MQVLTSGHYNAHTHAVLSVDIVGSSKASDDLLDPMKTEMETLVSRSFNAVGLAPGEARHFRETGDGLMVAYPDHAVGQLCEVVFHLDHLLRTRNRYARVPMRARVAVHMGPMADNHRYHRTYITLTRLLCASTFNEAVGYWCRSDPTGDKFGAGMIVSQSVWRNVVEPFGVALVPPARCARISVTTPDFADSAWIHLPGLDAEAVLAELNPAVAVPLVFNRVSRLSTTA
ncbi:hypothetical protein [Amycolatopsis alba]|uniref:Guanylate cyclase domain-containing protein n=1 Tax=Amycolatopsis alba DSM 44262 TaxID=1125972 RepID=A0A229S367_AMYAL|nr:hypothetical protein [Amycolatopsis alba]OXM53201.1 hypothetical protein CFP75_07720 [Amycolatopsis alba DSM 44262]